MPKVEIAGKVKGVLVLLSVLILAAAVTVIWDIDELQRGIKNHTRRYVADVSAQAADTVNSRLDNIVSELEGIGGSLAQIQPSELAAYLDRQAGTMGYRSFVIVDRDHEIFGTGDWGPEVLALPGVRKSLAGETGVSFPDKESILFTVPLKEKDEVTGILGCMYDKSRIQELIQPESFSGQGLTCIVNSDGKVVISPTNLDPFLQLDSIFARQQDRRVVRWIQQMKLNMKNKEAGLFRFEASDGSDLILSYHPLGMDDWVLLTLVPSNVISAEVEGHLKKTIFVTAGVMVLMFCIFAVLDVSTKAFYKQLERDAFEDRLTGGMNNVAFQRRCKMILPKAPPNTYAIVLLNIKKFKLVNVRLGSDTGDQVLCYLMDMLQKKVKGKGFVARVHADMFYLCLKDHNPDNLAQFIYQFNDEVQQDVEQYNQEHDTLMPLVIQSGVYIVDEPSLDITVMQDRARVACRSRSAAEDGVCKFYDAAVLKRLAWEQELNGMFEYSLENRDFKVYFQPKVCLDNGKIGSAEALVRWEHPKKGMIFPGDFIPLFEANGNVCKLDLYVFEEVCRNVRRWLDAGEPFFSISVNLSRQHFQEKGFLEDYKEIAARYQIPRNMIEMELTESVFLDDETLEDVKEQIRKMHEIGFMCSLDDFGSGFSSLGLLLQLDVDMIKLDRSLCRDINQVKANDIIASIVDLARKLGVKTVAEGVETTEQLEFLRAIQCDMVQGYIYSRPLPVDAFETWFRNNGKGDKTEQL